MIREVTWSAWDGLGLGHLRLAARRRQWRRGGGDDGMVLGVMGGRPFRLAYDDEPRCQADRRARAFRMGAPGGPRGVELLPDGEGNHQIGSLGDGSSDEICCESGSDFVEADFGDCVAPDRERVERV